MKRSNSAHEHSLDYLRDTISPSSHSEYHDMLIQGGKKFHKCTFLDCGKTFRFKSELDRHHVIHFPNRPYICPNEDCKKAFKRLDALENHQRIHTHEVPFKCDYPECDACFVTKAALRYHRLKHSDQRAYRCSFLGCDKSFLTQGQLKQHQKASNYHEKISTVQNFNQFMPAAASEFDSERLNSRSLTIPAPKFTTEAGLGISSPNYLGELPKEDKTEHYENMVKYMFQENLMLKEKLKMFGEAMSMFKEEASTGVPDNFLLKQEANDSICFSNNNESTPRDFIKGGDNNSPSGISSSDMIRYGEN